MKVDDWALSNVNSLFGSFAAASLVAHGVSRVVISPGSRSTPLTFALARQPGLECIPVLDERSAGFFALGWAKSCLQPVALVCTSGTAAANYLPAIIEAHESGVSLLILTADRPAEARQCRSGQTIDQLKLFGGFVRHFAEMPLPEATSGCLRALRQFLQAAVERSMAPWPGPVHLNFPFREPLPPELGKRLELPFDPLTLLPESGTRSPLAVWQTEEWPQPDGPGWIIAGPDNPNDPGSYAAAVQAIAAKLGYPVFADALNPVRHHVGKDSTAVVVDCYDSLLRKPSQLPSVQPETIICLGELPTSKVLRSYLQQVDADFIWLSTSPDNRDPLHARSSFLHGTPQQWEAELRNRIPINPELLEQWRILRDQESFRLGAQLASVDWLFEGSVAFTLGQILPNATQVFVASSMPVRDAEYFWPLTDRRYRFLANRGANGIDGTLSSAMGAAHQSLLPAVLLCGDLSFLHDSNGLLNTPNFKGSLTVIVMQNHGGGIFSHLPIAEFDPPFERFFATPQAVDIGKLCQAHGVPHQSIITLDQLRETLPLVLSQPGMRVLEVMCDRKRDSVLRRKILAG